jgi:hypothetical protein
MMAMVVEPENLLQVPRRNHTIGALNTCAKTTAPPGSKVAELRARQDELADGQ